MTTPASKSAAKPKAEKPAAPKAEAKKPAAKKTAAGGSLKVTQIQGSIARRWDQEATLKGLGLGKRHRTRVLQDTPEIRGMINKVKHLLKVENA
jgi:large subunit ribosomal protein L30